MFQIMYRPSDREAFFMRIRKQKAESRKEKLKK
jgi:hypothetical protein